MLNSKHHRNQSEDLENVKVKTKVFKRHNIIKNIHSLKVTCLIQLNDLRIATGNKDISISIFVINHSTNKWHQCIQQQDCHEGSIISLCEVIHSSIHKLISCSSDFSFKIWNIMPNELLLIKTIISHTHWVNKVISLTNGRIASCSIDHTIKIWESFDPFQLLLTLKESNEIVSILQLKGKEELVISCRNKYISFWNINKYVKEHIVNGYYVSMPNHMIELQNGNIALSNSTNYPNKIIIIDPFHYTIITEIIDTTYINGTGSLSVFANESFIYTCLGRICQIAFINNNYQLVFKQKAKFQELFGSNGVIVTYNDKYIITSTLNGNNGINIYKWT